MEQEPEQSEPTKEAGNNTPEQSGDGLNLRSLFNGNGREKPEQDSDRASKKGASKSKGLAAKRRNAPIVEPVVLAETNETKPVRGEMFLSKPSKPEVVVPQKRQPEPVRTEQPTQTSPADDLRDYRGIPGEEIFKNKSLKYIFESYDQDPNNEGIRMATVTKVYRDGRPDEVLKLDPARLTLAIETGINPEQQAITAKSASGEIFGDWKIIGFNPGSEGERPRTVSLSRGNQHSREGINATPEDLVEWFRESRVQKNNPEVPEVRVSATPDQVLRRIPTSSELERANKRQDPQEPITATRGQDIKGEWRDVKDANGEAQRVFFRDKAAAKEAAKKAAKPTWKVIDPADEASHTITPWANSLERITTNPAAPEPANAPEKFVYKLKGTWESLKKVGEIDRDGVSFVRLERPSERGGRPFVFEVSKDKLNQIQEEYVEAQKPKPTSEDVTTEAVDAVDPQVEIAGLKAANQALQQEMMKMADELDKKELEMRALALMTVLQTNEGTVNEQLAANPALMQEAQELGGYEDAIAAATKYPERFKPVEEEAVQPVTKTPRRRFKNVVVQGAGLLAAGALGALLNGALSNHKGGKTDVEKPVAASVKSDKKTQPEAEQHAAQPPQKEVLKRHEAKPQHQPHRELHPQHNSDPRLDIERAEKALNTLFNINPDVSPANLEMAIKDFESAYNRLSKFEKPVFDSRLKTDQRWSREQLVKDWSPSGESLPEFVRYRLLHGADRHPTVLQMETQLARLEAYGVGASREFKKSVLAEYQGMSATNKAELANKMFNDHFYLYIKQDAEQKGLISNGKMDVEGYLRSIQG